MGEKWIETFAENFNVHKHRWKQRVTFTHGPFTGLGIGQVPAQTDLTLHGLNPGATPLFRTHPMDAISEEHPFGCKFIE